MEHLITATTNAIAQQNWYAALALALTMPDICGRLADPTAKSQVRYEAWYDKYLLPSFQRKIGPDKELHTFLCASDCYALRCAFLHQGEFGIEDQRAQTVLARFHFTQPPTAGSLHSNQMDNALQLQVDRFCGDVCAAVRLWLLDVASNPVIKERMSKLGHIFPAPW